MISRYTGKVKHPAHSCLFPLSNSDLSVCSYSTTKYVILSEASAKSKNLRIFSTA